MFPLLCWWFCPGSPFGLASRPSQRGPASVSHHIMVWLYPHKLLSYTVPPVPLLVRYIKSIFIQYQTFWSPKVRPRNRIYHQPSNKVWECGFFFQLTDAYWFQNVMLVHPCQHVYWVGLGRAASTKVNIKQMAQRNNDLAARVICVWAYSAFKNILNTLCV